MTKCKISIDWTDNYGNNHKASIEPWQSLTEDTPEIIAIRIRAGMKSLYRNVLQKLGYSGAEIAGMLTSQMVDMSLDSQNKIIEQCKEFFSKIPNNDTANSAFIKPITE